MAERGSDGFKNTVDCHEKRGPENSAAKAVCQLRGWDALCEQPMGSLKSLPSKTLGKLWWAMRGLNPRPSRCKRDALPLS